MKKIIRILMLIMLVSFIPSSHGAASTELDCQTVVLSAPDDEYYQLAQEIAEKEGIPLLHTVDEAAAANPLYLLWVVAPQNLSEGVLMDFGLAMNGLDSAISVGIISGSSLENAKRLWQGAVQIDAAQNAIINGEKEDKIEGGILYGADSRRKPVGLSKDSLIEALATTSVIQISIEGAAGSWFDQVNGITVKSEDIPSLASSVILHYGCSTFRPWAENSIAMACLDQGAVAYAGFVDPSITGKRFGDYEDIAFLYTWQEFPLGHLVQIQNRAAMQHAAAIPHFFLLGDPRIYARSEKPYMVFDDEVSGERRIIHLTDVESGLIPIKIEGGAGYDFVNVCDLDAASMDSAFFNDRMQMVDMQGDKYLLIDHHGAGDTLTIELEKNAPLSWLLTSNAVDFLDTVMTEQQGSEMPLILTILVAVFILTGVFRRRFRARDVLYALIFASLWTLIILFFALYRKDSVSVTNIPVHIHTGYLVSILLLSAYGYLLYSRAGSAWGRVGALLLANLNHLVTFLIFAVALLVKLILMGNAAGINKPGYPWAFALLELAVGMVFYFVVYSILNRLAAPKAAGQLSTGGDSLEAG